jgi:hypothetical protein
MPPLKREVFRLILCCVFGAILSTLLFTGVDGEGEIKEWAAKPIGWLTSTSLLKFMAYYFFPFLAYTIIKAIVLNANEKFAGALSFLANQFTGALYCSAIVSASLSYELYLLGDPSYKTLIPYIPTFFVSGIFYFLISQCAIQKSMPPKLL